MIKAWLDLVVQEKNLGAEHLGVAYMVPTG